MESRYKLNEISKALKLEIAKFESKSARWPQFINSYNTVIDNSKFFF